MAYFCLKIKIFKIRPILKLSNLILQDNLLSCKMKFQSFNIGLNLNILIFKQKLSYYPVKWDSRDFNISLILNILIFKQKLNYHVVCNLVLFMKPPPKTSRFWGGCFFCFKNLFRSRTFKIWCALDSFRLSGYFDGHGIIIRSILTDLGRRKTWFSREIAEISTRLAS